MTTAEEWVKIYQDTFNQPDEITIHDVSEFERDKRVFIGVIEKIQLNARKQGITDVIEYVHLHTGLSTLYKQNCCAICFKLMEELS